MNGLTAAAAASFAQRVEGSLETPGGHRMDYPMMAPGAGYRDAFAE